MDSKKNKPKILILSMQRIRNYGSSLQAYGLKQILEGLGAEVTFLDYIPGPVLEKRTKRSGLVRKISKGLKTVFAKGSVQNKINYIKHKKNYEKNYFSSVGIPSEMNLDSHCDLLVIGSDEVFNCIQDNPNVGFTPVLFGMGTKASHIISYAGSFGNTTMKDIKRHGMDTILSNFFRSFEKISVRDENSRGIIHALTGNAPFVHLDPVLIYDFMNQCPFIPDSIAIKEKYMILYGYHYRFSKEECKKIKTYAKGKGLKVLCFGGLQYCCDSFVDCSPFELLAYFRQAECVITDTFHGTIFSIITKRPFVSVIRDSGYGNAEKLKDLLRKLELSDREGLDLKKLSKIPEYEKTFSIIEKERKRSTQYLLNEVKRCQR